MRHLMPLGAVLLTCAVLAPSSAVADKRGIRVDGKTPEAYIAAQTGKSYAVVIGINDYEKVPRLTYAKADAAAIATTLKQWGFAVTELYDKQASRRNILSELGDKLVDRVKEEDRVLIFYAGHGETKQRTGGKEIGYLLPVGGEQDALAETAIPMSMIRDLADALPAKQVLFLVDVCYGGIAGQQFRSLPKYTVDYLKAITRERGRQLITAGGPKQQAMEGPEWGHSVFTYYLLEGLDKGRADLNDDGIIPATELYAYLDERVFGAASLKGHEQRPVMWTMAAEKGEFVFFANRGSRGGKAAPTTADAVPDALAAEREKLEAERQQLQAERERIEAEKQLAAEKAAVAEERKKLDVAKAYGTPQQQGRELTGKDDAPMVLVPEGEFLMGENRARLGVGIRDVTADDAKTLSAKEGQGVLITALDPTGPGGKAGLQQNDIIVRLGERPIGKAGDLTALLFDAAPGWRATVEITRGGERKTIPVELGVTRGEGKVYVDAFYMDKYEVTSDLYAKFLQATGRKEPNGWTQARQVSAGNRPVIGIDWHDAEAYCRYYEKRLPTEAEWEKAARGTDGRVYPWGNTAPTNDVANYGRDWQGQYNVYADKLKPVGSYEQGKSPYGIYDLAGNVWEWVADWYSHDLSGSGRNPTGPTSGTTKVLRGGSWGDVPQNVRSAGRGNDSPAKRGDFYGFRCAKTP